MNGDEHRRNRRLVMGPFQKKAIANYHDTIVSLTQDLIAGWQPGESINVSKEMVQFMLRLTSSILFGLDEPEFAHHVGMKIERWVSLNHEIGPAAFTPDRNLVDRYDELLTAADDLEADLRELLRRKRTGQLGFDVLSLLIHAHDDDGGISDDQLMGHLALLFGAAHLTSAHTLTWTFFLLGQHPEIADSLFGELQASCGGEPPALDQLEDQHILDRVLKESMRILPASSYSQRIAAEPVDLGPFKLEPGAIVIFSQLITHHMESLYPRANRFLPERWESISPSPYAYLPFGAGPRMCIGAALGMMQIKLAVSTILGKWKLEAIPWSAVNARVLSTMLFPDGPVRMIAQAADGVHQAHPVLGNIHNLLELPSQADAARRAA
jgi:cytochrome P450